MRGIAALVEVKVGAFAVAFLATAFRVFPRFAVHVPARFVRLAITAAFTAIVRNRPLTVTRFSVAA
jgi:hypothetical protein